MAARRERERRRPTERRYRFASPEQQEEIELAGNGVGEDGAEEAGAQTVERVERPTPPGGRVSVPRPSAPVAVRTFSDYAAEYAYVVRDLRRVALVIGSLLVVLIILYLVLPH
jgi:hypothetical protein